MSWRGLDPYKNEEKGIIGMEEDEVHDDVTTDGIRDGDDKFKHKFVQIKLEGMHSFTAGERFAGASCMKSSCWM